MARRPTREKRDERVKVDLAPEEFIGGLLAAGPHEGEDDETPEVRPSENA